jgi:O-antigen/teichoic acid export membrane protein
VRSRAASGAAVLGARGALIYLVGIGANLLLARLLTPRDFGLVALGTVLVVLGTYLAEGGLGAALIRREQEPQRIELEAVIGLQLAALGSVAAIAAVAAVPFGRDGFVVATMVASLPIATLRAPSVIVLERSMRYRAIATADVAEAMAYYAWAIVAVAMGFGVWGMATAVVVRATIGTITVTRLGPVGFVRPRWSWGTVRPLVAFGAKFQANAALGILRYQVLNVVVASVAGLATLGVWNLAWRVLQVPALLFATAGRVTFPAMSRLLATDQDLRPVLERAIAALAVMTGVVVVSLLGAAVVLPDILGAGWEDVPAVILWSGVALLISSPTLIPTVGYLLAAGEAGLVAISTLISGATWCAVAIALLPEYGAPAVGIGWVCGAIVNAGIVWRRASALSGAALGTRVAIQTVVLLAAAAAAWVVGHLPQDELVGAALGLAAGEVVVLAGLAAVSPAGVRDARALVVQGLGTFRRRQPPAGGDRSA